MKEVLALQLEPFSIVELLDLSSFELLCAFEDRLEELYERCNDCVTESSENNWLIENGFDSVITEEELIESHS